MAADGVPAERKRDEEQDEDRLTYKGQTWRVESAPTVVDRDGESELVEVWVRRR